LDNHLTALYKGIIIINIMATARYTAALYPQRTEPLPVLTPYRPCCHLRIHIPHYPQYNLHPNPNPKSYSNLKFLTNKPRHAEHDVSAY